MSRAVPEWIGKTPDAKVPQRVRLRIFERYGGRCHISGRLIRPGDLWDIDHLVALINGGEHRESNMAPALQVPHREKTAEDVREKAITYRKRSKHLLPGKVRKGRPMPGSRDSGWKRKMNGEVVRR